MTKKCWRTIFSQHLRDEIVIHPRKLTWFFVRRRFLLNMTIFGILFLGGVHPGRLTWNLQITHLERKIIFQTSVIMFHVNLQGCKYHHFFLTILFLADGDNFPRDPEDSSSLARPNVSMSGDTKFTTCRSDR